MPDQVRKLSTEEYWEVGKHSFRTIRKESPSLFAIVSLNTVINGLSPIATAVLGGLGVAELAKTVDGTASLGRLLLIVVAASFVNFMSSAINSLAHTSFSVRRERVELALRQKLLTEKAKIDLDQIELPQTKDAFERAERGASQMIWIFRTIADGISAAISLVGAAATVLLTLPAVSLIMIILPIFTIRIRLQNYRLWRSMWESSRASRVRAGSIERLMNSSSGIMELRIMQLIGQMLAVWKHESDKMVEVRTTEEKRSLKLGLVTQMFEVGIAVAIDIWLVFRVIAGGISIGLFEQTRRLIGSFVNAVTQISNTLGELAADAHEVYDHLEFVSVEGKFKSSTPGRTVLKTPPTRIEAENLRYTYPNSQEPAVKDASLALDIGQHIAIVGANGAGKTTLIKLLLGQYRPQSGTVKYDGRELTDINLGSVYRHFSILLQDFNSFDFMTFKEAVALGDEKIDTNRVKTALDAVGLLEFVEKQPKGLDSNFGYVEEDGVMLSGGQTQRLAIARTLYRQASILILDEPTSAIDAKSEQEIVDAIFDSYGKGKSVILVSHRLSTVSRADRIIVMKDGRVAEEGTHRELFKKGTSYHDLFHRQALALK